jgi:hypothetical protein
MIIPKDHEEREFFYQDLIRKCLVSRESRRADYGALKSYYLFGSAPEESPAQYNKIYPHIDQLVSFLYSADTTRFSINLGASAHEDQYRYIPRLEQALNDEWNNSNADQVFNTALTWAMVYNSAFIKLVVSNGAIHPYFIDPNNFGVLREDIPYLDRQEAFVQTYYITKSDLYARLYAHPKRESIVQRVTTSQHVEAYTPNGVDRIILSQVDPTMYGNVNLNLYGQNRMKPEVEEDTIEMTELYVWNDETNDYQVVTRADPDVIIYDRENEKMFLKGESPFIQVAPNPMPDYYWGQSEVSRLMFLQEMRNKRMAEILDLLSKQVNPPTALMGFTGILDEKNFALNKPGGLLVSDMPNAKVDRMAPQMPPELFEVIHEVDAMFGEASGIGNILEGKGEAGVRSAGHASQLARLGSSRAKKRALIIEDSLEKLATLYLKLKQAYDPTHYTDEYGNKFIAEQFTKDYTVKVDAHSNSPIFTEDLRQMAFNLLKVGAIDNESLLDLLEPPMKQLLKDKLRKREATKAQQPQKQPPKKGGKAQLQAVE